MEAEIRSHRHYSHLAWALTMMKEPFTEADVGSIYLTPTASKKLMLSPVYQRWTTRSLQD
jgi:hypothetical protein